MSSSMNKKKKRSSKAQPLVFSYLPEEIITCILTRLPVKTLVRFRCVSRSWLNLMSTPNFINTHLVKSSKSFNFARQKIILWHKSTVDSYYLKTCSLDSLFSPAFNYGNLSASHPLQIDYNFNDIVGSCNGLVCILGQEAFVIWNPSTRESKKLAILEKGLCYPTFGFGHDQLNDDYKVVQMGFVTSFHKKVVELYSLQNNSRKKIGDFPNCFGWTRKSEFVNSALRWKVRNRTHTSFVLVSLDLGNETYAEIAEPNYGGGNCFSSLIVVEGCISLCYNFEGIRDDIWVMKEYGVRDSWIKLYTISYMQVPEFSRGSGYLRCLSSNSMTGEILLKCDEMLMIYHSKYGTSENKRIHGVLPFLEGAITYVESLVLLP